MMIRPSDSNCQELFNVTVTAEASLWALCYQDSCAHHCCSLNQVSGNYGAGKGYGRASAALIGTTLPKQEPAGATTGYINRTREDTLPLHPLKLFNRLYNLLIYINKSLIC